MAMGLTNAVIVGYLGGAALSAAGLGGGLYFTIGVTCQSVLTAVAPLAARAIGGRNHRIGGEIAAAGLVLAAGLAVPIIALLSVLDRLLAAIGYDPALATEIGRYLEAIRWGVPGFLAFGVLRALLAIVDACHDLRRGRREPHAEETQQATGAPERETGRGSSHDGCPVDCGDSFADPDRRPRRRRRRTVKANEAAAKPANKPPGDGSPATAQAPPVAAPWGFPFRY